MSLRARKSGRHIDWARVLPFLLMHAACLAVIWVGFSWVALAVTIALYVVRMFAITGFYHRYFSHRTFKTSRVGQFIFGMLGASAVQRGPIWWAAHHRHHHVHSDKPEDVHSPGAARLFLEPHGLVHVAQALRGGFIAREGPAQISRAAVPGSLRCRGSDGFWASACFCSACC